MRARSDRPSTARAAREPEAIEERPLHLGDLETWKESPPTRDGEVDSALVPTLTIAYHPHVDRIGAAVKLRELSIGQPVLVSRVSPEFSSGRPAISAPLADRNLSRNPIVIAASGEGIRVDRGECPTRIAVNGRPLEGAVELDKEALARGIGIELGGRIVLLLHEAPDGGAGPEPAPGIVDLLGESWPMRKLRRDIGRVADLSVPVLIRGESGSGKELVARALHGAGARRDGAFVAVNLGAIPQSLAVSELFGADRGAFTGAVRRQAGYFFQARGGTLFLDEVGEACPEVQVALLRALETGEIQAVGAQRPEKVDVRVIAATDADLEAKIDGGEFRAPLLYRLGAFELWVPPLRDRRDDIGRLLVHFLREELAEVGERDPLASPPERGEPWLPASIVARLVAYDWPGNVRQLRNVARQLVITNRDRRRVELGPESLRLLQREVTARAAPARPASQAPSPPPGGEIAPSERRRPSEVTDDEIEAALRACRWDVSAAAARLRISRPSLYMLMNDRPRFRTSRDLSADDVARAREACGGDVARMADALQISEKALRRRLRALGM